MGSRQKDNATIPPVLIYAPPVFSIVLYTISLIVGLVGNVIIILAYVTSKTLRQPSNAYVINLAVADLAVTLRIVPGLYNPVALSGGSMFSDTGCYVFASTIILTCGTSLVNIGAIAIVRYISIVRPV